MSNIYSQQLHYPLSGSFSGSLNGTASWANNAITASYSLNGSGGGSISTLGSTLYSTDPIAGPNFNITNSIFLGKTTGNQATSASYSTLIGYQVGYNVEGGALGIKSNNIIIGTNITLPNGTQDSINLGGIIFATGSYATVAGNPFSGSMLTGKVGINKVTPTYNLDVSGSGNYTNGLTVTGSLNVTAGITGSLFGTSSYATTASYAATSSYANNFTVAGTLTAQTLVVQTITSSTEFITGSTRFGSLLSNTHQFTGSVSMTGSLTLSGNQLFNADNTYDIGASGATRPRTLYLGTSLKIANPPGSDFTISQGAVNTIRISAGSGPMDWDGVTLKLGQWGNDMILRGPVAGSSNRAAQKLQIQSGTSSGNGAAAGIDFYYSGIVGTSGSTESTPIKAWSINETGNFIAGTDNTLNIGALTGTRPSSVFVASKIIIGSTTDRADGYLQIANTDGSGLLLSMKSTLAYARTNYINNVGTGILDYDASGFHYYDAIGTSKNSAASYPAMWGTGTWFTGGTATTTKPHLLIEPTGTTSTAWSTSGTGLGINASASFAGNLMDLQVAGVSKFRIEPNFGFATLSTAASNSQFKFNGVGSYAVGIGVIGTTAMWTNYTNAGSLGTAALSVSLTTNGDFGIGTTSPASKLHVGISPIATASYGTISIGGGAFDGATAGKFVGNASGSSIAVNETGSFGGNLMDLQVAGTSYAKVGGGTGILTVFSDIISGRSIIAASGNALQWNGSTKMTAPTDGNILLQNQAGTDFSMLKFGGTTNLFPAIARVSSSIAILDATGTTSASLLVGSTVYTGYKLLVSGSGTSGSFNANNVLYVSGSNVGIGTTTPSASLEVARSGSVSSPATLLSGNWFTGGTATTTKPYLLIEPTGTTSTAWSVNGTGLGINAASGFTGNLIDLQVNSVQQAKLLGNTFTVGNGATVGTVIQGVNRTTFINDYNNNLSFWEFGTANGTYGGTLMQFNGKTNLFPAIKRNGTGIDIRLADDTGYGALTAAQINGTNGVFTGNVQINNAQHFYWASRSDITSPADGNILLRDAANTSFGLLQLGGTTSSFPALKRTGSYLEARLADDSASTGIIVSSLIISQSLFTNQNTSSLASGTQTISTNATGSYTSAFYNYTIISGSNARAGQIMTVWNGASIQYTDNSTTDIGSTLNVVFTSSLSGSNVLLTTVLPSTGWTVKTLTNFL